jgi:hypothetical protein
VYALHEYESLPHTCVACFAPVYEEILGVCFPIPQSGLVSVPVWLVVDYGTCEPSVKLIPHVFKKVTGFEKSVPLIFFGQCIIQPVYSKRH